MSYSNHIYCVTHQRPLYPLPADATVIWVGDMPVDDDLRDRTIVVRDKYPDLDFYRPYLLGSAGSFAIRREIAALGAQGDSKDGLLTIVQQRKFITRNMIGRPASNYPGMQMMTAQEASSCGWSSGLAALDVPYLLSQPIMLDSYLAQYARDHRIEDLLRYTALAVELGILQAKEIPQFFGWKLHVPGGSEFGTYPLSAWMPLIEQLEKVALAFVEKHRPMDLSAYQRRGLAFCQERLGSFFIWRKLSERYGNEIPRTNFGFMATITEEGDVYKGGT